MAIFDDITERVRADEQLRYQSSLLDQIRDTVTATDLEGRITYVNEAQCRALNRTREELVGAPLEVFGEDPARGATQREIVAATRATGHWRGEVVNRTRSGRQLLVEVRTAQIYDATGRPTGLCRMGTDITERKLAEEQRRRQEEEFRAFVETTNDWIWAIDLTGRHIYSNPAVTTILGYDATEVVGQEALILLHPDDQARARDLLQRKVDHKEGWSGLVLRWRHKNGSDPYLESTAVPVFDGQGDLVAFRGADRDVTDRMRAAAVLREREAKLTSIFRAAPSGIGVLQERRILRSNDRTCEMTGYSRGELIGQSARVLYPSDEEFEYVGQEKYRQIADKGTGTVGTRWRRTDGAIIDVLLSSTPVEPGNLAGPVTFTALDITERQRAEEERRQLEAQMQQAQKLESLGVLAGGIAHDFNNLLMAILGNADLAAHGPGARRRPRATTSLEIANGVAAARRTSAGRCSPTPGRARFVVEAVDLSRAGARRWSQLLERLDLQEGGARAATSPADLPADRGRRDASSPGRHEPGHQRRPRPSATSERRHPHHHRRACSATAPTSPRTCAGDEPRPRALRATRGGRHRLRHGRRRRRRRIFDPFFTTKFTGRGLGLAAVLGIVRGHRGAIEVVQRARAGAPRFTRALPGRGRAGRSAPTPRPRRRRRGAAAAPCWWWTTRRRCARWPPRCSSSCGFTVLVAPPTAARRSSCSGSAPAEIVVRAPGPHHAAHGRRGDLPELRRLSADVRVIMASGYADSDAAARFPAGALAATIEKPFQVAVLSAALRAAIAPRAAAKH